MNKLITERLEIKIVETPHSSLGSIYEFCFDILPNGESKTKQIFAGIWWEDLYEFLKWSENKDGERPTEQNLNQWKEFVLKKVLNSSEICESKICFYAHKNNPKVLEFLELSLKGRK